MEWNTHLQKQSAFLYWNGSGICWKLLKNCNFAHFCHLLLSYWGKNIWNLFFQELQVSPNELLEKGQAVPESPRMSNHPQVLLWIHVPGPHPRCLLQWKGHWGWGTGISVYGAHQMTLLYILLAERREKQTWIIIKITWETILKIQIPRLLPKPN